MPTSPSLSIHAADMAATNSPVLPAAAAASTPRHVRAQSMSSDRPSTTISQTLMSPPLSVSPEAVFIAGSAASQIVTNDHDGHSETWYDQVGIEPSGETALVSPGALQLANNFIDQLLFNILGVARSTSLSALRPAVSEVLKPKLAKDATNQADEELREYLGGGEVDDLVQSPDTQSPRDWDLELVWKRTRLRCMVYSSLGDMEEEDEDYFMEQEHLNGVSGTLEAETVSPAVAIFLTSILEFMGEQVLVISGQAAFNRMRTKYEKELKEGSRAVGDLAERVVVEELDMERVALDRTLGRLWRSWKKRIRSPVESGHQRSTPSRIGSHSRHGSIAAMEAPTMVSPSTETIHEPKEAVTPAPASAPAPAHEAAEGTKDERDPTTVPLPMSHHDVAEIEVPGLVSYSDEEDSDLEEEEDVAAIMFRARPKSLVLFSSRNKHTGIAADTLVKRTNSLPSTAGTRRKLRQRAMAADASVQGAKEEEAEPSKSKDAAAESITGSENAAKTQAAPPAGESADSLVKTETKEVSQDGPVTKIVAGASAIGTAALAGVAALAQGTTPQTTMTPEGVKEEEEEGEEEEEEVDEFTEEPEILTSSRVSMCGRSSPSTSESGAAAGRPSSILVGRSNSLRSVRMIDVQPRSPSVRSAHATVDFDYAAAARSANYSREGSASTPPIVEEGDSDEKLVKGSLRSSSMKSSREASRERMMAPSPSFRSSSPSSALAPTSAPAVGGPTKVSILNTAAAPDAESRVDPPPRMPSYGRQPTLPTLPERSANRPTHGKSSSYTTAQSVERPSGAARGSPESPKRTRPAASESPSSTSSTRFKAVPSTEDSGANRAQDVARNFEALLQNDQTLQYTLTPENMRDMEVSIAPAVAAPSLTSPQASGRSDNGAGAGTRTLERSRSSSLKRSLSVTKTTGLHSHPPEAHANARPGGPVPRAPPVSMNNQARSGPGPQARDARVPRESIQDFADFIRSTGPSGNGPTNRTGTMPAHRRDISQPVPPTTRRPSIGPKRTASTRARLQARDAAVSSNNESSDLIDFIRRGPPSNAGNNPRIPRNVAPFRTTMDSDQLQMTGASSGKAVDATIPDVQAGRVSTTVTEHSIQSSINSSTALLNKANKPAQYTNNFDEEDMLPKRKQRRVRDPYAIDFSDEDDDDLLEELDIAPKPKPRQEESLIDFLNNCEPPPEPSPPQPFVNTQQAQPKKKQSAPNLLQRLRGAGGGSSSDRSGSTKAGDESRSSNSPKAGTPGQGGGGGRGYTPIVANVPPNAGNVPSNTTSTGSPRAPPVSGRVPMKSYEPRDPAMSVNTKTSDLARFLRESEPPPSTLASPSPPEEKATGFARIFERRKKSTAY